MDRLGIRGHWCKFFRIRVTYSNFNLLFIYFINQQIFRQIKCGTRFNSPHLEMHMIDKILTFYPSNDRGGGIKRRTFISLYSPNYVSAPSTPIHGFTHTSHKNKKILYRFNFASDMIDKINDSIDYTKTLYFLVEPSTFL